MTILADQVISRHQEWGHRLLGMAEKDGSSSVGPFQRVSVDLVEHESVSTTFDKVRCRSGSSIFYQLARFALLVAIPKKSVETVICFLPEQGTAILNPAEHSIRTKG